MPNSDSRPSLWKQVWRRMRPVSGESFACPGFNDLEGTIPGDLRSFFADSYPHNHTYTAAGGRLVPARKLVERLAQLTPHYPKPLESLLDLSCSKGFFVFHAAAQPTCERALGIDLNKDCVDACRLLNTCFDRQSRVDFASVTLPELAERIDEFGGPFQTGLLINTYQYLVLGSAVGPPVSHDHREIFRLLRKVCSGRLIFHNRLSLADLQSDPQDRARRANQPVEYEPAAIHAGAAEYFSVNEIDSRSRRPVWVLDAL